MLRTRRSFRAAGALIGLALIATACGTDSSDDTSAGDEADAGGGADTGDTGDDGDDGDDGDEADMSVAGDVEILDAFTGDVDVAGIEAVIAAFEAAHPNINVERQGSSDFEQLVRSRVEGGDPPDIAFHPQPGLLADFVSQGFPVPLDDVVDVARLQSEMVSGLVDLGTFNDTYYGLQVRLSLKSLVWYSPANFAAEGFEVPTTWKEMQALTDEIVSRGETPWCIGIESSSATGWVATDWIEDLVLRALGGEWYDAWTRGEQPFNDPDLIAAIETYMEPIWFGEGTVFGGRPNILQTSFGDSVLGILDDPEHECYMHRQASFITGFMPEGTTVGPDADVNFFYLPPTDSASPVLIAGDLAALYTQNDAAKAFMRFMATAESGEPWAAQGAYLSPFATFDNTTYGDPTLAAQAEIITAADFARFDGSDLMPGAVGAGAFWTELVEWINGTKSLEEALEAIDEVWRNL